MSSEHSSAVETERDCADGTAPKKILVELGVDGLVDLIGSGEVTGKDFRKFLADRVRGEPGRQVKAELRDLFSYVIGHQDKLSALYSRTIGTVSPGYSGDIFVAFRESSHDRYVGGILSKRDGVVRLERRPYTKKTLTSATDEYRSGCIDTSNPIIFVAGETCMREILTQERRVEKTYQELVAAPTRRRATKRAPSV